MEFDCGLSHECKRKAKEEWHAWFAWYPVRIAARKCVWLQTIRRKGKLKCFSDGGGVWYSWVYEYAR